MKTKNEIDYQELTKWALDLQLFGIKLGLSSTEALLSKLGDPQKQLKAVHIAGSNGKGSTAAFLAHILRESGFRVGFYSSPHLIDFRERFLIDWKMPSREKLAKYMVRVREVSDPTEPPTFFEFTTALAFLHFAEEGVDAALIETGLGGRLDATNIIRPQVSVITTLTLEHTQYLGRTIEEIAFEKAGIIKEKTPVILGRVPAPAEDVIRRTAAEKGAPLYIYGRDFQARAQGSELDYKGLSLNLKGLKMGLAGPHQSRNAAVAMAALEVFSSGPPMAEEAIRKGMAGLSWPGRLQVIGRDPPDHPGRSPQSAGLPGFGPGAFGDHGRRRENRTDPGDGGHVRQGPPAHDPGPGFPGQGDRLHQAGLRPLGRTRGPGPRGRRHGLRPPGGKGLGQGPGPGPGTGRGIGSGGCRRIALRGRRTAGETRDKPL